MQESADLASRTLGLPEAALWSSMLARCACNAPTDTSAPTPISPIAKHHDGDHDFEQRDAAAAEGRGRGARAREEHTARREGRGRGRGTSTYGTFTRSFSCAMIAASRKASFQPHRPARGVLRSAASRRNSNGLQAKSAFPFPRVIRRQSKCDGDIPSWTPGYFLRRYLMVSRPPALNLA